MFNNTTGPVMTFIPISTSFHAASGPGDEFSVFNLNTHACEFLIYASNSNLDLFSASFE